MNPLIIIPTYISAHAKPKEAAPVATYDHMTALTEPGELGRMLKSLEHVNGVGSIAVLVAGERSVASQAVQKVRGVCGQFPSLSIMVIGRAECVGIVKRMEQLGLGQLGRSIGLTGYSAIRNLGLVVANIFGFDAAVFLDDDEVIDDPDFLAKGVYGLGKLTRRGIPILAKTGYYLNSEGTYHSKSRDKWYNHYWEQGKAFNAWIDRAMSGPRLSRSNHVCGGCLALHREAFRRVCFDPWIVRGEDLDYMLNLRMYGSDIWFDNRWQLHHLPPESTSEGLRFRQDIFRWIYEFRKVEFSRTQIDLQQVKAESLEPYPGPFLRPGIGKRIKRTALLRSLGRPDKRGYRKAAHAARVDADAYAQRNCTRYFEFQYVWPEVMLRTENDEALRNMLLQSVVPRDEAQAESESDYTVPSPANRAAHPVATNLDPGVTSEIRLNLEETE